MKHTGYTEDPRTLALQKGERHTLLLARRNRSGFQANNVWRVVAIARIKYWGRSHTVHTLFFTERCDSFH